MLHASTPASQNGPLRVLLAISCLHRSGPTIGFQTLTRQLHELGVDTKVLALSPDDRESCESDFVQAGVSLQFLGVPRWNPAQALRLFRRSIRGFNANIVHTTGFRPDTFVALLRATGLHVPVVSTVRSRFMEELPLNIGDLRGRVVGTAWARSLRRFDVVVPHSEGIRQSLRSCGVPDELLHVVRNGIDCEAFVASSGEDRLRARISLVAPTEVLVGYVGRLVKLKALDVLIRAFAEAAKSLPIRLLMVGEGPERPALEELAVSLGVGDRVVWVGDQRDVRPYLRAMDIFAMSSLTEGLPRALLEAGATGLPAVVTNISGCNEVVTDGYSGYVVPVNDPDRMCDAFGKLAMSSGLRHEMGQRLRKVIEEKYSARTMALGYIHIYQSLLGMEPRDSEEGGVLSAGA
jgi:glycosyltransferase involved in cell wall biosynthesis